MSRFARKALINALLLPLCMPLSMAHASPFSVTQEITASDGVAHDQFSRAVGISGNVAIVGAWQFLYEGSGKSGAAYLFDVSTGRQRHRLTASDAAPDDAFGISAAIDGNFAVVGAALNDEHGSNSGAAYVFNVSSGNELVKLKADDAAANRQFGNSIAIRGGTAIVGAPNNPFVTNWDVGAAYLFDVTTGVQIRKLLATDSGRDDEFGSVVALHGSKAIVGAHGNCPGSA